MKQKLVLSGLVALGLGMAACSNEDINPVSQGGNNGTTFAGMYISAMQKGSRGIAQEDYAGREAESKLNTLDLLSNVKNQHWSYSPTASEDINLFWEKTPKSGIFTVSPWMTNAGKQTVALILNQEGINSDLGTATNKTFGSYQDAKGDIAKLSTDDKFLMTSSVKDIEVLDGISKEEVKSGTDHTKNVFSLDVERVVAQGLVAKSNSLNKTTSDGKGTIDLDNVTYAAINGAVETYLFGNHAGNRTLNEKGLYQGFKSAIDDYKVYQNAQDPNGDAKNKLIRLGNLLPSKGSKTNDELGNYKAIAVSEDETNAKSTRGIYFLENSVDKESFKTKENKDYGFYRLAYAKIYAIYTPKEVLYLNGGKLDKKEGTPNTTFYKGADDGLIYETVEAAQASQLAPGQKVYTYTNGKCAYRALWNRQLGSDGKTVVNADVRRNNTYLLTIKAFQGLGMPWDPSDPNDPNLPKPGTKEEGKTPENPDIEKEETYMRVEAKVLQWNLVSREVTLE